MTDSTSFDLAVAAYSARLGHVVRRHPRAVASALVVGLAGFAVAAFGTATQDGHAAIDPSLLVPRIVSEPVPTEGIAAQVDALSDQTLDLYRSDTTRAGDNADTLLRRLSVDDAAAAAFLRNDPNGRRLFAGRPAKSVQVRTDVSGRLVELVARYAPDNAEQATTHFNRLTVAHDKAGSWQARVQLLPLDRQVRVGTGTVRSSLFLATDEAHLPDPVATQLIDIFSADIDFHHQLQRGDTFSVVYEALSADGQPCTWMLPNQAAGRVLAAEFVNKGKPHSALWFQDAAGAGKGAYFDFRGQSKRRAFLASPVAFSRVTSGFSMRFHPIMQLWRHHDGVDFGAPTGTPVHAIGDAVVDFAGWQNGYGNVVVLKHSGNRSTVYAHLSRIEVRRGQQVGQGAVVGAVGSTGWATGPHLHFEFKLAGKQLDPLAVARAADSATVADASRMRFSQLAQTLTTQLQAARSGAGGDAYGE